MYPFKGKAIYNPTGKAGEYSQWACNFYVGCSGMCAYCYCKKGVLAHTMGGNKPELKSCLNNGGRHKIDKSIWFEGYDYALYVFENELEQNLVELQKHGLFFSFTTDPLLIETIDLTFDAVELCIEKKVPVKILTKQVPEVFEDYYLNFSKQEAIDSKIAFGFTLTGHDELEPGCATNAERIEAMRKLHEAGFKTFASIEPIIDFKSSFEMILHTAEYCNVFKIGLESGKKYSLLELKDFIQEVIRLCEFNKVYFKDFILKQAGMNRNPLPECCVNADYNIFKS